MIVAVREGSEVYLRWRARDPYFETYKDAVKSLRVRQWDKEVAAWRIPYDPALLEELRTKVDGRLELHPDLAADLARDTVARTVAAQAKATGDADLGGYVPRTEPWPHQRAAVIAAKDLDAYGLFWEMGTGKSKAAIDISLVKNANRVLIVGPNEVKYNWDDETRLHAGERTVVLDGPLTQRIEDLDIDSRFFATNVESLAALYETLRHRQWDAIIVDEATRFKNPDAQRTRTLLELAKTSSFRMVMTGTPVTKHIYDLYAPMNFLSPGIFGRYGYFRWRYFELAWDKALRKEVLRPRADTIDELLRIVDTLTYRVTKKEVLPWLPEKLPPKTYHVTLAGDQLAAYRQMYRQYKVWLNTLTGPVTASAPSIITRLLRLSEITSGFIRNEAKPDEVFWFPDHPKARVTDELVEEHVADGRKVVIFCVWRPECEFYERRYDHYGSSLIFGGMQPRDRHAIVRAFQNEEDPRVLVCQIGSGGIGINLTAAATAIYTSRDYDLEHWLQSQDRLHRSGQKQEVNLITIKARETADEHVEAILSGKADLADIVTKDRQRA